MLKLAKVNRKLSIYSNLRLTIKWIHIYVEIRKLQILVLSNLYLEKLVVKHLSSLEDWKSQFCHAAAKKFCGSGNCLILTKLLGPNLLGALLFKAQKRRKGGGKGVIKKITL